VRAAAPFRKRRETRASRQLWPLRVGMFRQELVPCGIVIVLDLGRCLQVRVGVNIFRVSER
jgi:hypothetical protein